MRFRLRTLLIVLAVGPMVLADEKPKSAAIEVGRPIAEVKMILRGWPRLLATWACRRLFYLARATHESAPQSIQEIGTPTVWCRTYHRAELQRQSSARSTRPALTGLVCM